MGLKRHKPEEIVSKISLARPDPFGQVTMGFAFGAARGREK